MLLEEDLFAFQEHGRPWIVGGQLRPRALHADELCPHRFTLFFQPIGIDEARAVRIRLGKNQAQKVGIGHSRTGSSEAIVAHAAYSTGKRRSPAISACICLRCLGTAVIGSSAASYSNAT